MPLENPKAPKPEKNKVPKTEQEQEAKKAEKEESKAKAEAAAKIAQLEQEVKSLKEKSEKEEKAKKDKEERESKEKAKQEAETKRKKTLVTPTNNVGYAIIPVPGANLTTDNVGNKKGLIKQSLSLVGEKFGRLKEATLGSILASKEDYEQRIQKSHSDVGTYLARFQKHINDYKHVFETMTGQDYDIASILPDQEIQELINDQKDNVQKMGDSKLKKEALKGNYTILKRKIEYITKVTEELNAETGYLGELEETEDNIGLVKLISSRGNRFFGADKKTSKEVSHDLYKMLDKCENSMLKLSNFEKSEQISTISPNITGFIKSKLFQEHVIENENNQSNSTENNLTNEQLSLESLFQNNPDFKINSIGLNANGEISFLNIINIDEESEENTSQIIFDLNNLTYQQKGMLSKIKATLTNRNNSIEYINKNLVYKDMDDNAQNTSIISPIINVQSSESRVLITPPPSQTYAPDESILTIPYENIVQPIIEQEQQISTPSSNSLPLNKDSSVSNSSITFKQNQKFNIQSNEVLAEFEVQSIPEILKINNKIQVKDIHDIASKYFGDLQPLFINNIQYSNKPEILYELDIFVPGNPTPLKKYIKAEAINGPKAILGRDENIFQSMVNKTDQGQVVNISNNRVEYQSIINFENSNQTLNENQNQRELNNTGNTAEQIQESEINIANVEKSEKFKIIDLSNTTDNTDILSKLFKSQNNLIITGVNKEDSNLLDAKIGNQKTKVKLNSEQSQLISTEIVDFNKFIKMYDSYNNQNLTALEYTKFTDERKNQTFAINVIDKFESNNELKKFFGSVFMSDKIKSNMVLKFKIDESNKSINLESYNRDDKEKIKTIIHDSPIKFSNLNTMDFFREFNSLNISMVLVNGFIYLKDSKGKNVYNTITKENKGRETITTNEPILKIS